MCAGRLTPVSTSRESGIAKDRLGIPRESWTGTPGRTMGEMMDTATELSLLILLFSNIVFASILCRLTLERVHLPAMPGYIGIGLQTDPSTIVPALVPAAVITAAAFLGKFLGAAASTYLCTPSWRSATLLGVGMIPRAEVAMITVQRGATLSSGLISDRIFSVMVMMSATICLVAPVLLNLLLGRWRRAG